MRSFLLSEPSGPQLVARYRGIYGIAPERELTEEMVRRHWDLERRLTKELLASSSEERWEVFERCYSTLYRELPWLNEGSETFPGYEDWPSYVGPPPKDVYEVGSGSGALARFLAERGYRCRASEITRERGDWDRVEHPNMSWGLTDGVHLDRFETAQSYGAVISNQVIEHLHPDDLLEHLRTALTLLRPGGRYVVATPHAHLGPTDVSAVFRANRPMGMHLKEYTYAQLCRGFRTAGFSALSIPLRGRSGTLRLSRRYLSYLRTAEILLAAVPTQFARRTVGRRILRPPLFTPGITMIAQAA